MQRDGDGEEGWERHARVDAADEARVDDGEEAQAQAQEEDAGEVPQGSMRHACLALHCVTFRDFPQQKTNPILGASDRSGLGADLAQRSIDW